jgi:hypothetical protein
VVSTRGSRGLLCFAFGLAGGEAGAGGLFATLWRVGVGYTLYPTGERRGRRPQRDRLRDLGYEFAPLSQDWHLQAA